MTLKTLDVGFNSNACSNVLYVYFVTNEGDVVYFDIIMLIT
jgi:hypothetical protein